MTLKRLGLLGGTFDPIHLGHLIMASQAVEELKLNRVLFMPAQVPPHKLELKITPTTDRIAMVKVAIEGDPRFQFSDFDVRTGQPSYTSELVERIHCEMPDHEIYFIAGADSLRDFPTWHEPAKILEYTRLAIAARPGVGITNAMLDSVPTLRSRVLLFESPLIDISSTDIRHRAREGRCIRYLVPSAVERYIQEKAIYRDDPQE